MLVVKQFILSFRCSKFHIERDSIAPPKLIKHFKQVLDVKREVG